MHPTYGDLGKQAYFFAYRLMMTWIDDWQASIKASR
jgi:hypothetical protein